jgi:hypothetical protein
MGKVTHSNPAFDSKLAQKFAEDEKRRNAAKRASRPKSDPNAIDEGLLVAYSRIRRVGAERINPFVEDATLIQR